MDWLLAAPQIQSAFSALGSFEGDTYVVSPNALAILEEINYKLTYEDQTLRTFRRAIGFGRNVRIDLIPLLENAKDQAVLDAVIRILVNLTVPIECLFSVDIMYRTEVGRHTIFELTKLLYNSKEAFTDSKSTKAVVEYMKNILESESKLSLQKCDQINNCLLLLRNILHIPETITNFMIPVNACNPRPISMQNIILWNLFIQSIDKLLLYLMTCPQRSLWSVTMVQLIALMYKDQHVSTLQKLLNSWFEASLSESSEDNESNTTPPKQVSGDSSPMLTSDPTSDASDNGSTTKTSSSKDRRQALREETDATLKEVSRKGQVYQDFQDYKNSIKNSPQKEKTDKTNMSKEDFEKPCTSTKAVAKLKSYKSKQIQRISTENNNDAKSKNVTKMDSNSSIHESTQKSKYKYPSNNSSHNITSNQKILNNYKESEDEFMPPPAIPTKAYVEPNSLDSSPQPHQKVPHAGKLNLTKGKSCPQKRECPSSQSELSDCGYATQIENQESISTSSNDDDGPREKPQHQKPPCNSKARAKQRIVLTMVEKKELRRKKLVRRGKSSLINMKGLVPHTPTDEDISHILKEFTVDFLLKAYGHLVEELHKQLLTNKKVPIDTSHFFWLVTYFLQFAAQFEMDMEYINSILTYDIVSYLTYEGVFLCEQLELNSRQEGSDLKPYLRRMHLVVTAIREFLQAVETYKKVTHLSEDDRARLQRLQLQISTAEDLRCLFVLLLRRFNPTLHTKQYLQDLVVTNHLLLLIMDGVTETEDSANIKMLDHISQFANADIMHNYGILLEDFNKNGEFINNCIFTMMHHVGGDLGRISTLFQPVILKTYSRIWETDYELCDDWSDLIEYVMHKFINTPQESALILPKTSLTELTKEHNLENAVCIWTKDEMDTLYWYYVQSKKDTDVVGKILDLFSKTGNKQKSRISVINQLLQQDIITLVEYDDLMKFEDVEYKQILLTTPTSSNSESGNEERSSSSSEKPSDDMQFLRNFIIKAYNEKHIIWLQKVLLECCYIKLMLKKFPLRENRQDLEFIMEPVAYHAIMKNRPIPLVQWNNDQACMMFYQPFILLLHKLGFQLPADAGSFFARIPDYWSEDIMFDLAQKLGPLDKLFLKFDARELREKTNSNCKRPTEPSTSGSFQTKNNESSSDRATTSSGYNSRTLTPIAEIELKHEKSNEIFAVPKVKHCNSIIRFTPDPSPVAPVPNWLQLVILSKCKAKPPPSATSAMLAMNPRMDTKVGIRNSNDTKNDPKTLEYSSTLTETTAKSQHQPIETSEKNAELTSLTESVETTAATMKINDQQQKQQQQQQQQQQQKQQHQQKQQQQQQKQQTKQDQQKLKSLVLTTHTVTKPITTVTETISCSSIIGLNDEQINQQDENPDNSFMNTDDKIYSNHSNGHEMEYQSSDIPITIAPKTTTKKTTSTKTTKTISTTKKSPSSSSSSSSRKSSLLLMPSIPNTLEFEKQNQNVSDDDLMVKSFKRSDTLLNSSFFTRYGYSASLEREYSAMVAEAYKNVVGNSSVTASVNSDLTQMYVSDEDEHHELTAPKPKHF